VRAVGVIEAIDAATGPTKQRIVVSARELVTEIAAAQLAGEDFLVGLDRQRTDVAGQQITPVPGWRLRLRRLWTSFWRSDQRKCRPGRLRACDRRVTLTARA
jgi:hypothetical protein